MTFFPELSDSFGYQKPPPKHFKAYENEKSSGGQWSDEGKDTDEKEYSAEDDAKYFEHEL